jgi:ribonuclease P protein component
MRNTISLRLNKDFRRLYSKGVSLVSPSVVIYYKKTGKATNRLGITVSKKNGKAVLRNRIRRIIKEAYRQLEPKIKKGYDFVFVARAKTAFLKSTDVKRAIEKLLCEKNLLEEIKKDGV